MWVASTPGRGSHGKLETRLTRCCKASSPWIQRWIDAFEDYQLGYIQHMYDEPGAALMRAIDRVVYDGMSAQETADLLQDLETLPLRAVPYRGTTLAEARAYLRERGYPVRP